MIRTLMGLLCGTAAALAVAGEPSEDQKLLAQAAAQRAALPDDPVPAQVTPARPVAPAVVNRTDEEREARLEAHLALARLELVLARQAMRSDDLRTAALHALQAQVFLVQVPPQVDVSDLDLQAEGVLARAQQAGIAIERLRRDARERAALPPEDAALDRAVRGARDVARSAELDPRDDIDLLVDERTLRERTIRRQQPDRYGYRPGRELIDLERVAARGDQRVAYQEALLQAYREDEARLLIAADEARIVPQGDVAYPADWRARVARRKQWEMGQVARSESWFDKDGREWYVAIYDLRDILYEPPNFAPASGHNFSFSRYHNFDRRRYWDRGFGWGFYEDTLPMLRYFGGVDPFVERGPKYSAERQREVVQMIQAFTGAQAIETEGGIILMPGTPPSAPPQP